MTSSIKLTVKPTLLGFATQLLGRFEKTKADFDNQSLEEQLRIVETKQVDADVDLLTSLQKRVELIRSEGPMSDPQRFEALQAKVQASASIWNSMQLSCELASKYLEIVPQVSAFLKTPCHYPIAAAVILSSVQRLSESYPNQNSGARAALQTLQAQLDPFGRSALMVLELKEENKISEFKDTFQHIKAQLIHDPSNCYDAVRSHVRDVRQYKNKTYFFSKAAEKELRAHLELLEELLKKFELDFEEKSSRVSSWARAQSKVTISNSLNTNNSSSSARTTRNNELSLLLTMKSLLALLQTESASPQLIEVNSTLCQLDFEGKTSVFSMSGNDQLSIGNRPFFHLYFIHKNETPEIVKDDREYGRKAFSEIYPATNHERFRSVQRTIVELALETIEEAINADDQEKQLICLDLLETIKLDVKDRANGHENAADHLYHAFGQLFIPTPRNYPSSIDTLDRASFHGAKGIDPAIKIQAVQQVRHAMKAAWKL